MRLFFPVKEVIAANRSWLVMAAAIFLICAVAFFYGTASAQTASDDIAHSQLNQLQDLFLFILDNKPLVSALLLFMNNYISMVQMLLLGCLLGISPLITLGLNGALVGMLLSLGASEGYSPAAMVMLGILPHGIFELFAFFLCGALGLKFGYHCIAFPLPGKTRMESYRFIWKEAISVLPLVILLLAISAFVEITITPRLFEIFYPL